MKRKVLNLLLFIGCFIPKVFTFHCPNGSDQMPNEDICMYSINQPQFYNDVIRRCSALGGQPAKIKNLFENSYIFSLLSLRVNGSAPYIGVERKMNNTWTYADGSPLIYSNWAIDEPNMTNNSTTCAIMDPQVGKWYSAECTFARPFICSIDGDDVQCPDGWVYNEKTDFCYYLQNFTYPDSVYWQLYNWTTAEANCQRMNSHLVSIHSKEEDDFVYALVTSNVRNMTNVAPDNDSCLYQSVWIGYFGNGTIGTGKWTDGSPVDYIASASFSGVYYWRISNDASCNDHEWIWAYLSSIYARFVCKMPSNSRSKREFFAQNHKI